jgi:4-carboxymuconolactone decarboxylase
MRLARDGAARHGAGARRLRERRTAMSDREDRAPERAPWTGEASDRFRKGWARLGEVDGEAGRRVVDGLRDLAPDLARYIIEFGFGDVYSRPGLDLRARELATVAGLTCLGTARPQLEVHLHGALNVGCSRAEIVEVLIQMSLYAGFPAALNAVEAARKVFAERDAREGPSQGP